MKSFNNKHNAIEHNIYCKLCLACNPKFGHNITDALSCNFSVALLTVSFFFLSIKYYHQSQHNQERFQLAVKHLLEHENFSPDRLHRVVKDERPPDLHTTVQKTTESRVNQDIEQRKRDSLDPM